MAKQFPIGLPLHQIPKQGDFRKFILPPPGHCFIVADVDSQETKLMTDFSGDPSFMDIYKKGLNPHAVTAAAISGVSYDEIVKHKDGKHETIYKAGKVTNLGKNYRMGHKGYDRGGRHFSSTLYQSAHVNWGLVDSTEEEVRHWGTVWERTYEGVIEQQNRFIEKARTYGYAETLAGRRFYIDKWAKYKWKSQSSAIMFPIQGSGAEMKYLAIAVMRKEFPGLTFWGEIHDEIIYTLSVDRDVRLEPPECLCLAVKETLDNLPYDKAVK
jgi:DNA polymerase-1